MGKRNAYTSLVGKPKGKRTLGRRRRRWTNNIKVDLGKIVWSGMDRIGRAQDSDQSMALVNAVMKLRVAMGSSRGAEQLAASREGRSFPELMLFYAVA
jgi:hypothetical protein